MPKILIVDDAKLMRNIIKRSLTDEIMDLTILEASNGHDAVEMYKATRPDVVTLDITMDILTGDRALEEIMEFDPNAKVIMATALGQEQVLKKCIQTGAKDYLVKPFKKERVIMAVKQQL